MILGWGPFLSNRAVPSVPILDMIAGAGAAYGVRRLRTAYSGAAVRVLRSSDNVEQDIGFTSAGNLDNAALLAFVGAGNGFVVTWYDQSGNARHLTQTTAASQPQIVSGGVIQTLAGRPAMVFDGVNDVLTNNSPFMYAAGAASVIAVLGGPAQIERYIVAEGSSASNNPFYAPLITRQTFGNNSFSFARNDANSNLLTVTGSNNMVENAFDGVPKILTHIDNGSQFTGFRNGVAGSSLPYTRSGTLTLNRFAVGALQRASASNHFNGPISELIVFPTAVNTATRQAIENNINSAYAFPQTFISNICLSPRNISVLPWYVQGGATVSGNTITFPGNNTSNVEVPIGIWGGTANRTITAAVRVRSDAGTTKRFRITNTHGGVLAYLSSDFVANPTAETFTFTVTNGESAGTGAQNINIRNGSAGAGGNLIVEAVGVYIGSFTAEQIVAAGGIV